MTMLNKELIKLNENNIAFMRKQSERYKVMAENAITMADKERFTQRAASCLIHAAMWEAENKKLATLEANATAAFQVV